MQQAAAEEPPEIEEAGKKPVAVAAAILATSAEITALQEKDTDQLKAKTVEPAPPEPVLPTEPTTPALDDDAAFAWLESLAVKQGADEALLLKPAERLEKPPDWIVQEAGRGEAQPAMEPAPEPAEPAVQAAPVEAAPVVEAAKAEAQPVVEAPRLLMPYSKIR